MNPFPRRRPGTWGRPQGYLFQIYDYYRTVYGSEKGQDLIEYALLLALIVAVGILIYQQSGLKNSLLTIFSKAGSLASDASTI